MVDSVKSYMRISQRMTYHRKSENVEYSDSYLSIMENRGSIFLKFPRIIEINRVRTGLQRTSLWKPERIEKNLAKF